MHGDEKFRSLPAMPEILSRDDVVSAFRTAMLDHYRTHVPETDFTESTLTASDYLNQFQGLVKMLDKVSTQLEGFAHEFLSWNPMTYEEHIAELDEEAVAAYRQSPTPVRARFDDAVAHLHGEAIAAVDEVVQRLNGSKESLNAACENAAACLRILGDEANAIARGEILPPRGETERDGNVIFARFGRR
jgi:hypothetical protein